MSEYGVYQALRDSARGQACLRCEILKPTVVGAHYTGARRLSFGGGYGRKVHDAVLAHLCQECHHEMDTDTRDKSRKWEHSEEFLYYCARTWIRWLDTEILIVNPDRTVIE